MPALIPDKSNTAGSTLDATGEFNPFKNDLYTVITSSSQTPTNGVNDQWPKAVTNLSHWANFYTDSGTANAYVLSIQSPVIAPTEYKTGMLVRFRAGNANTGASTVNVASLGVKIIFAQDGTTALSSGELATDIDSFIRYDESLDGGSGAFIFVKTATQDASTTVKGIVELVTNAEIANGTDTTRSITTSALASLFNQSDVSNGYARIPIKHTDGTFKELIIQFGITASVSNEASLAVTLPITCPTACVYAGATMYRNTAVGGGINSAHAFIDSTSQITVTNESFTGGASPISWLAIGY